MLIYHDKDFDSLKIHLTKASRIRGSYNLILEIKDNRGSHQRHLLNTAELVNMAEGILKHLEDDLHVSETFLTRLGKRLTGLKKLLKKREG